MTTPEFNILIVGSGPAGVSAAFPLVESGMKVLMVDGGECAKLDAPVLPYLENRRLSTDQWKWMLGGDNHALKFSGAVSPKLRTPTHAHVFSGFEHANKISSSEFIALGSLAAGGLSNAWGCGVAKLSAEDLTEFPFPPSVIEPSFAAVSTRMGISGATDDDLKEYYGLDNWADRPIELDTLQGAMLRKYQRHRLAIHHLGIRLGRSRVAALSKNRVNTDPLTQGPDRLACNLSGNCLWGCYRKSLYSALYDLDALKSFPNFTYRGGLIVDQFLNNENYLSVFARPAASNAAGFQTFTAKKLVLAAGTLATTRLAMHALKIKRSISMLSCPTAAFMLWRPTSLGRAHQNAFGLGQLSYTVTLQDETRLFGSLFSTTGIPTSEFARFMPLNKPTGLTILSTLLSSAMVGNLFLPGKFGVAQLKLNSDNSLCVSGSYASGVPELMQQAKTKLASAFRKLGAVIIPKSFTLGQPGGDIHYSSSLPMRYNPTLGETHPSGELYGMPNVFVVDGASLSSLSEKSHTLTIMANADRIGRGIVSRTEN